MKSFAKKCLAVFLSLAILCSSFRVVTGRNLIVQEAEASALVTAIAGATGLITGGSVSLAPALVPLASLFAASGIFIDNTSTWLSDLTAIFDGFTDTVKEELTTIGEAALNSALEGDWTPSALLLNEFKALVKSHFFNEDGSLKSSGYLAVSDLPAYEEIDFYTSTLPDVFNTRLSTVPAYIPDTNITVKLIDSPWTQSTGYEYPALYIENTDTGKSMTVDPSVATPWDFWNDDCGATFYISSPYVRSEEEGYSGVGFYVSVECPVALAGGTCSHHYAKPYTNTCWAEGSSGSSFYKGFILDGFNAWYDGLMFANQAYNVDGVWTWVISSDQTVVAEATALSTVLGNESWLRQLIDGVLTVPEEDTVIYIPHLEDIALALDTLTKAGTLENDWTLTIADYLSSVNENTATTNSWLEKIYNFMVDTFTLSMPVSVQTVFENVFTPVVDVVSGFWDMLPVDFIVDGVPKFFEGLSDDSDIYEFWRHEEDIDAIFG